jgi:hypothetical protein
VLITKVSLTKAQLEALPQQERVAIILLGHAINEIQFLRKLLIVAIPGEKPPNVIVDRLQSEQVVILMRILLGKLHEAWLMFTKRVQPLRARFINEIPQHTKQDLTKLYQDFDDGRVAVIRNTLSFHYRDDEDLVEKNWRKIGDEDPLDFYLHDRNINSFYYGPALIITRVMAELGLPSVLKAEHEGLSDEAIGFSESCKLCTEVTDRLLGVYGEVLAAIVYTAVPEIVGEQVDVGAAAPSSQLMLPFFWDEADYEQAAAAARN